MIVKNIKPMNLEIIDIEKLDQMEGKEISIKGAIHRLRILPNVTFCILRLERTLIQVVAEQQYDLSAFLEGDFVEVTGLVRASKLNDKAILNKNYEISLTKINLIHRPKEVPPFEINKKELNIKPDLEFDMRQISLRHPKKRAIFKISETIANSFASFLETNNFTRIFSPKIVFAGAEGGANIFKIQYFDRVAYLAQSPQFYKQYGVGIFGKVYDIGPVFRAEKHNTTRHVNEYISLDFEMGFISSFEDIMALETAYLKFMIEQLIEKNSFELELLEITLPEITDSIPSIKLKEAHEIFFKIQKIDYRNEPDLSPDEEKFLTQWSKKEYNSEFLFVTHFPTNKRPFYTMDDPSNPGETLSFDLLFRGLEITTGGQRIHDYDMQYNKLISFGMNPEDFESFLTLHKYGVPPHGGLAIGLERLTARICNIENIKEASMYPRDINRITP
ncbi:MAG: aspartate--tRNA(Asn) ligase [Exilispira sp.]|jgi:nondiscriminating aspartyl-tRNA synthetase|nr:aspartate--tRNA(Asn) ligase [Exilispira sp.]